MDANSLFDAFISATNFTKIQQLFNQLCALLNIDPYDNFNVFKRLRSELTDWRATKLWTLLDKRAQQKEYCNQRACQLLSVLVIGAGPCGLRSAIECALLGAYVVLVEQRDCFSRNNVLHIWPFVIQDLKNLGIKIFYPKFCRGSIDHISIRQLQIFLLKVALVLGVQVHESIEFKRLIFPEPDEQVQGWRAEFDPPGHILSEFVFDALIGADGKRNTVPGFPKREMRGKLAIGITANFINHRTLEEENVPEISGVAYIFNQQFFKDMKRATGVDLENIVYYKDETHYFVMCAKKQSLLDKGVILEDGEDVSQLLSPSNVDQEKLCKYATEAADFATNGKLPSFNFALNHNGKEDVAMFDFTSLFSAQCSVRLVERHDKRLLMSIVGDTLHEPFWPTGSGCARGFLGVFDVAWMLRAYGLNTQGLVVLIAERESTYRLLAQAKPDNLHKQVQKYTIDPKTRYVSLEITVQPHEISHLIDTDNPRNIETDKPLPLRCADGVCSVDKVYIKRYKLWRFCQQALQPYRLKVFNFGDSWNDGRSLAALIGKFRPDLIDYLSICASDDPDLTITLAMNAVEKAYGIAVPCTSHREWIGMRYDARVAYIDQLIMAFKSDSRRMHDALMNSIRTTVICKYKRKANPQVDTSRAKKTEPIRRRTTELLNAFSSTTVSTDNHQEFKISLSGSAINIDQSVADASENQNSSRRLIKSRNSFSNQYFDSSSKSCTKRPHVDKLDPERLHAVEKIVTGEVAREKTSELYRSKQRLANILTRKMDKRDIDEMKSKLEQTGMGLLVNREQFRVLTSREQKILSANAAAARQTAQEGFKSNEEKYKEIDERLSRADAILKNKNLAGVDIVTRTKENELNIASIRQSANGKPPPIPPRNISNSNNHRMEKVNLRKQCCKSTLTRPCSVPALHSCYDSVNARRQINCQLCKKVVYLAERMQVEGMYIHSKCFRCAYCAQPLRLGHCSQDRNLRCYGPMFFCTQHINLGVQEKMAKIGKNTGSQLNATYGLNDVSPKITLLTQNGKNGENIENFSQRVPVTRRVEINSPSILLGRTMKKLQAQKEAVSMSIGSNDRNATSERAEFETSNQMMEERRNLANSNAQNIRTEGLMIHGNEPHLHTGEGRCSSSDTDEIIDFVDADDDDDDSFSENDLIDIEKAIQNNLDERTVCLSEEQAFELLQQFKERRRSESNSNYQKSHVPLSNPKNETSSDKASQSDRNIDVCDKLDSSGFAENRLPRPIVITSIAMGAGDERLRSKSLKHNSLIMDEQMEQSSSSVPGTPCNQGLLARLFISEGLRNCNKVESNARNCFANGSHKVSSESQKEAGLLERSINLRRLRSRRENLHAEQAFSPDSLRKDIQRIQKRAEQIIKQKQQELIHAAQNLQRELEETEIRKAAVVSVATDLEKRLENDAENQWILEQWLMYVQEMEQLKQQEDIIRLRISEFEVFTEYKKIQAELKKVQNIDMEMLDGPNSQYEKDLLKKTLIVIEKRDAIQIQLKEAQEKYEASKKIDFSPSSLEKGSSYLDFQPVFI